MKRTIALVGDISTKNSLNLLKYSLLTEELKTNILMSPRYCYGNLNFFNYCVYMKRTIALVGDISTKNSLNLLKFSLLTEELKTQ